MNSTYQLSDCMLPQERFQDRLDQLSVGVTAGVGGFPPIA